MYYLNVNTTLWDLHLSGIPKKRTVTVVRKCQDSGAPSPMELTSRSWPFMFLGYGTHPPIVSPIVLMSDPPWKWGFGSAHLPPGHSDFEGRAAFGKQLSFVWVPRFPVVSKGQSEFLGSYARVTNMACTTQAVCVNVVFTPNLKTIW